MLFIPIVLSVFLSFSPSCFIRFPATPHAFTNKIELIVEMKTKTTKNRKKILFELLSTERERWWSDGSSSSRTTDFLLLV